MAATVRDELVAWVDRLPESNQRLLLRVVCALDDTAKLRRWSPAVGAISDEDAGQMLRIIEDGCESIDAGAW